MTMQDHLGAQTLSAEVQQCIALCVATHRLSVEAIEHYVSVRGATATPPYVKLLHDTAQITLTTADVLERNALDAGRTCAACAEATHQAAQATEGLAPDTLMETFIRQCRACAAACRHVANLLDTPGRV